MKKNPNRDRDWVKEGLSEGASYMIRMGIIREEFIKNIESGDPKLIEEFKLKELRQSVLYWHNKLADKDKLHKKTFYIAIIERIRQLEGILSLKEKLAFLLWGSFITASFWLISWIIK